MLEEISKREGLARFFTFFAGLFIVIAAVIIGSIVFQTREGALIFQGNASLIHKSEAQKESFVIGGADLPQTASPCSESGKMAQLMSSFVYQPLVSVSAPKEAQPVLAESVIFSKDGKTAEVTIKDVVFSDGTPLTAETVRAAYDALNAPSSGYPKKERMRQIIGMTEYQTGTEERIAGLEVLDEKTLRFQFQSASLSNVTALTLPIVKASDDGSRTELGTGPYQIESIRGLEEAVLVKNSRSEGNEYPYQTLRFVNMTRQAAEQEIEEFGLDVAFLNQESSFEQFKEAGYYDIYRYPSASYSYLGFSSNSSELLRKAVCVGFDQKKFWEDLRRPSKETTYLPVGGVTGTQKEEPSFSKMMASRRRSAGPLFKKLLKERDGQALRFLCEDTTRGRLYFKEMQEQFSPYGIEVEAVFVNADSLEDTLRSGEGYDFYFQPQGNILPEQLLDSMYQVLVPQQQEQAMEKALQGGITGVYHAVESDAANRYLLCPVDTQGGFLAVSADHREQEFLLHFIEQE